MYTVLLFPDGRPQYKNWYRVYCVYDDWVFWAHDRENPKEEEIVKDLWQWNVDVDETHIEFKWYK